MTRTRFEREPAWRLVPDARRAGEDGIAYDSVRRLAGTCLGLFVPAAIVRCRHAFHATLHWDGRAVNY